MTILINVLYEYSIKSAKHMQAKSDTKYLQDKLNKIKSKRICIN